MLISSNLNNPNSNPTTNIKFYNSQYNNSHIKFVPNNQLLSQQLFLHQICTQTRYPPQIFAIHSTSATPNTHYQPNKNGKISVIAQKKVYIIIIIVIIIIKKLNKGKIRRDKKRNKWHWWLQWWWTSCATWLSAVEGQWVSAMA